MCCYNAIMQHRFSIISYFDETTTNEIRHIQALLLGETHSQGSLTSWLPHITVGSGLVVEDEQLPEFYNTVEKYVKNFPPITIATKDFGYMDNWLGAKLGYTPYVVYIKPHDLGQLVALAQFFEDLKAQFPAWYNQPWPYQPHITTAFKDLTKDGFIKAQRFLAEKTYEKVMRIDSVSLAEKDEHGVWTEQKRFQLRG